jgi:hypothetical protein
VDNARPSTAQVSMEFLRDNGMKKALQPPYSSNFAPSDFYRSGHVKGCSFADADELLQVIQAFLNGIEKEYSRRLFSSGRRKYIQGDRDDIKKVNQKSVDSEVFIPPV